MRYRTSPDAEALQWLAPAQTAGGGIRISSPRARRSSRAPGFPTQDSPASARPTTPASSCPRELRAVMSAEALTPEGAPVAGGARTSSSALTQPIPPYLDRAGGRRHRVPAARRRARGVYAEPSVLERPRTSSPTSRRWSKRPKSLLGPYRWGRYDVLVLPPSFPFGGMENPRLTFATPTVLAGDRSLVSLIAHELAHSWSGNLVTNATWSDFWLNEGFTTYFEHRIMEALYGAERARMLEVLGLARARQRNRRLGEADAGRPGPAHRPRRAATRTMASTQIPYEKGAAFAAHASS